MHVHMCKYVNKSKIFKIKYYSVCDDNIEKQNSTKLFSYWDIAKKNYGCIKFAALLIRFDTTTNREPEE